MCVSLKSCEKGSASGFLRETCCSHLFTTALRSGIVQLETRTYRFCISSRTMPFESSQAAVNSILLISQEQHVLISLSQPCGLGPCNWRCALIGGTSSWNFHDPRHWLSDSVYFSLSVRHELRVLVGLYSSRPRSEFLNPAAAVTLLPASFLSHV